MDILIGILGIIGVISLLILDMLLWTLNDEYEEYTKKQNIISYGLSVLGISIIISIIIWMFN